MYKGSFFYTSIPIFVVFCFLFIKILTDARWYLTVIWICVSWMIIDVEHIFTYMLVICMSFSKTCLYRSFAHFFSNLGCFPFGIESYNFQILTLYQMYGLKFSHFVLLLLSCFSHVPTLCDPIEGSPPGSAIPGILQAKTLEFVAISFSNARKWKVKMKLFSCVQLFATPWTASYQAPPSMGFSRQEYWSGLLLPSPPILWVTY